MAKTPTPEQKAHSAAWHKQWRKDNPDKVALTQLKHYVKKANEIARRYAIDLVEIQKELAQAELKEQGEMFE